MKNWEHAKVRKVKCNCCTMIGNVKICHRVMHFKCTFTLVIEVRGVSGVPMLEMSLEVSEMMIELIVRVSSLYSVAMVSVGCASSLKMSSSK